MSRIFIGIDPGVNTGFAVWEPNERVFKQIDTFSFWWTIKQIEKLKINYTLTVVIEDVTQNSPTFDREIKEQDEEKRQKIQNKISQNVGSNKRDCQLIIEYCEGREIEIIKVRPTKGGFTKLDADQFRNITKHEGRTSNHGRDAAMLVFGR